LVNLTTFQKKQAPDCSEAQSDTARGVHPAVLLYGYMACSLNLYIRTIQRGLGLG